MTPAPPRPPALEAEELSLGYGPLTVVDRLSTAIPDGRITAIVGANASGKSTLLRGLARLSRPTGGRVLLRGEDVHAMPTREVARRLSVLPQSPTAPDGITVVDLVARGRQPHQGWASRWSAADEAAVDAALAATDTSALAGRVLAELSGGQRQRVWIAMVLAQEAPIVLLDEPTTFLDVAHQLEVLDLLWEQNREADRTVVLVLHDLNHACRYADHLIAMKDGAVAAAGPPADVLTTALVRDVFGVDAHVLTDPVGGGPLIVPVGRHHTPTTRTEDR